MALSIGSIMVLDRGYGSEKILIVLKMFVILAAFYFAMCIMIRFELIVNLIKFQTRTKICELNIKKDHHFKRERRIMGIFKGVAALMALWSFGMIVAVAVIRDD